MWKEALNSVTLEIRSKMSITLKRTGRTMKYITIIDITSIVISLNYDSDANRSESAENLLLNF